MPEHVRARRGRGAVRACDRAAAPPGRPVRSGGLRGALPRGGGAVVGAGRPDAACPAVMAESDRLAGELERASTDAVEAAVLAPPVGALFDGVVVDVHHDGGGSVQIADPAVLAPVSGPVDARGRDQGEAGPGRPGDAHGPVRPGLSGRA